MVKIERFEDIIAWQKARELTLYIYKISSQESFNRDYELKQQIRRAAISVMLNIAEGYGRRTRKEFISFLANAHGSVAEIQAALYVALDQKYLNLKEFDQAYKAAEQISKLIAGFSNYLKEKEKAKPGSK